MTASEIEGALLEGLTGEQKSAVTSSARRLVVVAGAGSGKTEVMARRVAWWIGIEAVPRDEVIAFTFTEKAAEEMKFRIRKWVGRITPEGEDATLGGMYIGTIHGFCLEMLQELVPEVYGVFDVLDDTGRLALVQQGFNGVLGLARLRRTSGDGQFETIRKFLFGYDMLHEFDLFEATGPAGQRPEIGRLETDWIKRWRLVTDVGDDPLSEAFAVSAARYYGALHARRLVDFSTAQSELVNILRASTTHREQLQSRYTHLVVDEFQDVNPVQDSLVRLIVGESGALTAVGDHRQAIYSWRGGRVGIMGDWFNELDSAEDGSLVTLHDNFRSTERVIELANEWAKTIVPPSGMTSPNMEKGNDSRVDHHPSHVAFRRFDSRLEEAEWIAATIKRLVDQDSETGVRHDDGPEEERGIGLPDIAILTRTSTDTRTYLEALERNDIPAIVRAGPDLFQRPEVLLLLCALCIAGDVDSFFPGRPPTMASIAQNVLGCDPEPAPMVRAAADHLATSGLPVSGADAERLISAAEQINKRLKGMPVDEATVELVETEALKRWLRETKPLRRIFPQTLFQWLAAECGIARWDASDDSRAITAMFHVGQLAGHIAGIETPGWVSPTDLKWQLIALTNWGSRNARSDEAPLLVQPNAVSILTIHAAKGLEFPVVFLADVAARRFPSQRARSTPVLPFYGPAADAINPSSLADNDNYDGERRLMYVALTRAERYLFVSTASAQRSRFEPELRSAVVEVGGEVDSPDGPTLEGLVPTESDPTSRLVTSFSDLRYYLECPHDYYLRKVLGFAPTIDQAFGYGRGLHNLMREIHLRPKEFAEKSGNDSALEHEAQRMIDDGLFYLRYTTGEPLNNMKKRAKEIVIEYVNHYSPELSTLEFEPERAFETLIEEADVLVSGAIDVIRHDDPPRVTLIDFKSGDPGKESENASGLDKEQMQLQVSLYALAARKELEYEPGLGIVRYLGVKAGASDEERELLVPLDPPRLDAARQQIIDVARDIQDRKWNEGPRRGPKNQTSMSRCDECDFILVCGRPEAMSARASQNP